MNKENHSVLSQRSRTMTEDERVAFVMEVPETAPDIASDLLVEALQDNAQQVRYAAAQTIGAYDIPLAGKLEASLLKDPDFMVRLACAESLGMLRRKDSEKALIQALSDRHYLVRGWAADSLTWYPLPEVKEALQSYLSRERMHFGQVNALAALIQQGETSLLPRLMTFLNDRNYRVRCATVRILAEIATPETAVNIKTALKKRQEKEKAVAVRSAITTALTTEL